MPYIKENFNSDIINTLNRLADTMALDNDYLELTCKEKYRNYCEKKDEKVIIYKEAFKEHEAVLSRILRMAINNVKGNLHNIEKVHIYDLINLQKNGTGKRITLPGNLIGFNNYGNIELFMSKSAHISVEKREYNLHMQEENYIEDFNLKVTMRLVYDDEKIDFKEKPYIKYFDFDKIKEKITLRTRKNGDRFTPLGMKGSKKLKDLFIDLKIPKEERDCIPLICFGNDIAWIVGYRISEIYKVNSETKNILEISIRKGNKDEGAH